VHLVNHEYEKGFKTQKNVLVTVPLDWTPRNVILASPDLSADMTLKYTYSGRKLSVVLPSLVAYSVIVVKE
jgi:hypothetical protein